MLKFPHVLDNRLIDGGKVVSPMRWPPLTPKNIPTMFHVPGQTEKNSQLLDFSRRNRLHGSDYRTGTVMPSFLV
jgi:hypothetical protein